MGMFSWAVLEPEEGRYNFDWLEEVIDNLYKEGIYTILSTPSGARPKWMADKYEEVLRMDPDLSLIHILVKNIVKQLTCRSLRRWK